MSEKETYQKNRYLIYQLKQDDSTRNLRFESLDGLHKNGNIANKTNYELVYSAQLTPSDTLESIFAELNLNHPSDFRGHSLSVSDIVVFQENGKETAHYCDSFDFKEVPEFYYVETISACRSNYKDMTAFVGADDKVYIGKSENYIYNYGDQSYYNNADNSLVFVSDNKNMYYYLYSEGWNASQDEMLKQGFCTESDYAEFAKLQNGILSQLEKIREFSFAGKPFNYLETSEKTEEQNFNQIDGQINNIDNVKDDNMENSENNKLTVLVVEPMKAPYVKDIEPGLKSLQAEVGGNIEAYYPFDDEVGIICNEEGKINGSPLNRAIYDDDKNMIEVIAGTFLICGLDDENSTFASLDADMIKKYSDMFKYPEQFFRRDNEIVALPIKPSIREQLQNTKKELGDKSDPKPPYKAPPEL